MKRTQYKYYGLVRELAITEFKLKYQGSVVGYLWSLMKPLAIFGVLYLVFTVFVKIGSNIPHYPVYLLLGIVLWSYFAESTSSAMNCIVDKGDLIRKIYFPRIVLLMAASVSATITFLLNLAIVVVFMVLGGVDISWQAILFPVLLVELYLLTLGLSLFLSALFVKFRDFAYIWEVGLQMLFYASAIIFPLSVVPAKFTKLLLLSPITQIVQDARHVLVSPQSITSADVLSMPLLLIPYLVPVLLVLTGYVYFERSAAKFAEDV